MKRPFKQKFSETNDKLSTCRGEGWGVSLSVIEVSDPTDSLSLRSPARGVRRCARGEAGGARRDTHTILWVNKENDALVEVLFAKSN